MPTPLFNFNLRPLEEIHPWGASVTPYLHWFGLTDGEYWIEVGSDRLFEYSDSSRTEFGGMRFCDYQVVRLYEDILELAPYALEIIPIELRRYITLDKSRAWNQDWTQWCAAFDAQADSEQTYDLLDEAGLWMGNRTLDSAYLASSANIIFWSDTESVHIEWDNREKVVAGNPTWAAEFGHWMLPRSEFINEVLSFHSRLMTQMAERISQIAAGALPAKIRIDMEDLLQQQQRRAQAIDHQIYSPPKPTDWAAVSNSIKALTDLTQRHAQSNPLVDRPDGQPH